ncbi:37S ribosomal protein S10 [Apiospora phragmitis]|uniref:37S ribosomal protein S10 n=1 Tax=Apiospora phragmitis TaxID=2905665 RepID=A0ABR1ULF0_9PEZI
MSRSSILQPLRQTLTRPVVRHRVFLLSSRVLLLTLVERHEVHPDEKHIRLPRAVQSLYLQPLRREAEYGVPTCDLQLRSFSIPNLEFFCDFAIRAAYYLDLPAFGPVPLPKITERWTVPRSHFIFKKSQENFERITRRRLIQIRDGHPESVQIWLAFLQKHAYYGIGMKANVWGVHQTCQGMTEAIEDKMKLLGRDKTEGTVQKVQELLESERFRVQGG